MLYEMLTGELPLGRFEPLCEKIKVDGRLDEVVLRCLAKEPDRRYQQVSELQDHLAAIAPPPDRLPADRPQPSQARRRHHLLAWLSMGLLATAVVALLAWQITIRIRSRDDGTVQIEIDALAANQGQAPEPAPLPTPLRGPLGGPRMPNSIGFRAPLRRFPTPSEFEQHVIQQYGADRVLRLSIDNLPGDVGAFIQQKIRELAGPVSMFARGAGQNKSMSIICAPVSDIQSVASQIGFGTVTDVDLKRRLITVRADPSKLPEPLPPEITNPRDPNFYRQNLADLKCFDNSRVDRAIERLAELEPVELRQEIADSLEPFLLDTDPGRRRRAVSAFAVWATKDVVPGMIDLLRDDDAGVRRKAVEILVQTDDPRVRKPLAALLVTDRKLASTYLRKLGAPAQQAVAEYFDHPEVDVRRAALEVAKEIATKEVLPELITALSDREEVIRHGALDVLNNLRDERSVAPIVKLLSSERDRGPAARCLMSMGPMVEGPVLERLGHADPNVVGECCNILAAVGTEKSLKDLQPLTQSSNFFVRVAATKASRAIMSRQSPK